MKFCTALLVVAAIAGNALALPPYTSTIRAPSFPLAVRTPHASIWLPHDTLPGHWPAFLAGSTKGWTGFVRVDGKTYTFMGAPTSSDGPLNAEVAEQLSTAITPTQTIFEIRAGPVTLTVRFLSPVEYEDVQRQTMPLSYVFVDVTPNDGASHDVQVYMDISAEWASDNPERIAKWSLASSPSNSLKIWSVELVTPYKFAEVGGGGGGYPEWGQAVIATSAGATYRSASAEPLRKSFITSGSLDNSQDNNFRCIKCDWPSVAFAHDLGSISASQSKSAQFVVGHIREENINLRGVAQKALWTHYWETSGHMIDFFYQDVNIAVGRANALDEKVLTDAFMTEGQAYADIVALSLRQAYGATEFSGNITHPNLYLKEISSNGNMQTVDVMYPAIPVFYYLNVKYLEYLLEPLWYQMENPFWPKDYAIHDIGFSYPNATGHDDGVQEDMPVEESANMLHMVGHIVFHPQANPTEARLYAEKHYPTMSKWANFLYENCLYPENQLTTDDFIGHTELNSGLALKGILGMATFAKISKLVGNTANEAFYKQAVESYIQTWIKESMHQDGTHLKMEYNVTNGYQFKYNAYQDKVLNLQVIPQEIYELEANYYLTKEEPYGIPFVSTHDYTKSDWEMWTASAFGFVSPKLRTTLVECLARTLRFTKSRVPFSDWYVTATGLQVGFQARPVVGGHFALLAMNNRVQN